MACVQCSCAASKGRVPALAHVGCRHPCSPSKQGTPELLRTSDCDFMFEWETPLVCPDEVKVEGCSLMDEQLYYSFNLSSLSKSTFKVAPRSGPGGGAGPGSSDVRCVSGNATSDH